MCVAVAVAFPQDVVCVEVTAQVARVGYVLVVLFLNQGAHIALQVEFEHTVGLVATLVELESQSLPTFIPLRGTDVILAAEQRGGLWADGALSVHVDDNGDAVVERIAGLGILLLRVFGLHLVGG